MTAIHTFDAGTSGDHDLHPFWGELYARAFPAYQAHSVVTDVALQKAGIDHRLQLAGGGELLVDVKCRCTSKQYHSDILVEVWSDRDGRVPGWARKPLRCHYVAYGWPKEKVGHLFPFHLLQRAYERNKTDWAALAAQPSPDFRVVDADNGRYVTRSVAVPVERLHRDVAEAMTVYLDPTWEPFT